MRFMYVITAVVFAANAGAQTIDDIPVCALTCLRDAITSVTNCAILDSVCHCTDENYPKIQAAAKDCIVKACGVEVAENEVTPTTEAICRKARGETNSTSSVSVSAATLTSALPTTTISSSSITPSSTANSSAIATPTVAAAEILNPLGSMALFGLIALVL